MKRFGTCCGEIEDNSEGEYILFEEAQKEISLLPEVKDLVLGMLRYVSHDTCHVHGGLHRDFYLEPTVARLEAVAKAYKAAGGTWEEYC